MCTHTEQYVHIIFVDLLNLFDWLSWLVCWWCWLIDWVNLTDGWLDLMVELILFGLSWLIFFFWVYWSVEFNQWEFINLCPLNSQRRFSSQVLKSILSHQPYLQALHCITIQGQVMLVCTLTRKGCLPDIWHTGRGDEVCWGLCVCCFCRSCSHAVHR